MHRAGLTILALALTASIAVVSIAAAAPRTGYYIDTSRPLYIKTKKNKVKSLQAPCLVDGQAAGGFAVKGLHINRKGKFHFSGKVVINGSPATAVIDGKVKKKATGSVAFPHGQTSCEGFDFSAKYYGKHPQG